MRIQVAGLALVLVALGTPAVGGSIDPNLGRQLLQGALEALDDLDSYRLEVRRIASTPPAMESVERTVRVHSPEFRLHVQQSFGGEVGLDLRVIGEDGWVSYLGGAPRGIDETGRTVPDPGDSPGRPETQLILGLLDEGVEFTFAGSETIEGVPTLHYAGRTMTPATTPSPTDYYRPTLDGQLDVWIHAQDGHLVRAFADVMQPGGPFGQGTGLVRVGETITVTHANDPSNVVEPPPSGEPMPPPTGDPTLGPMIEHAHTTALAGLDSFRLSTQQLALGFTNVRDLVVLNRPVQAVHARLLSQGELFLDYLIVGERLWTRGGGEGASWKLQPDDRRPSCNDEPCTFETTTVIRAMDVWDDRTFTMVSDESASDGVPAIHLRSTAGLELDGIGWVPGAIDLWIARDGGHLLRSTVDGQAIASSTTVTAINDPANTLVPPGEAAER